MKLTAAVIRTHRVSPGLAEEVVSDDELNNGHVRFRDTGNHAYYVCHGTPRKWRKVCNLVGAGALGLEQARVAAMELLTGLAHGRDPAVAKAHAKLEAQNTFGALIEAYVANQRGGKRKNTVNEIERYLNNHAASLHRLPVKEIDRSAIAALLADIEKTRGPGARNNTRSYASSFFNWMRGEGFVDINPVLATNRAPRTSRDRLLSDSETQLILTALAESQRVDPNYRDIVRLLFLTGLRRGEVAKLEWREVDFDRATLIVSASRMKNHREHVVPMSEAATEILGTRYARLNSDALRTTVFGHHDVGFSSFARSKHHLDRAVSDLNGGKPVEWILHDIRRYVSTTLNERLNTEPHVVEAILAHYPQGVSGVYNRSAYALEKRRALDKLAAHLDAVKRGKMAGAKVIGLRRR